MYFCSLGSASLALGGQTRAAFPVLPCLFIFYFGNLLPKEGKMNFAEGLRGLGFSDADISFLHRDYAFESMCKDMKIKPYMRNKSETKIILLYLFKSRLSKNRKNQKIAYSLDTKHFICHFLSYPFQPILED